MNRFQRKFLQTVSVNEIPDGWMGLDIGSDSLATFKQELSDCQTVVWNGPMGVFEFEKFSHGTFGVAHALAEITERYDIYDFYLFLFGLLSIDRALVIYQLAECSIRFELLILNFIDIYSYVCRVTYIIITQIL